MTTPLELKVEAGYHGRYACPVSVVIEPTLTGPVSLEDTETGAIIPGYITVVGGTARLHWLLAELDAGQSRVYRLRPESVDREGVAISERAGDPLDVTIGGAHFTSYHFGAHVARPFCYPVNNVNGSSVTRNALDDDSSEKVDHWWHRSLYVAFGEVNDNNNWDELEGHGRTVHDSYDISSNQVFGDLTGHGDWVTVGGEPLLRETRCMRFYDVGTSPLRVFDMDLTLRATNGPVHFGDTKEGGLLSVRVAPSMNASGDGKIENSFGGINETECWGKRANWCDYSGPVNGQTTGIAVMEHPGSFRSPTYWHVRNYGLMGTNPFGVSAFERNPEISGTYTLPDGDTLSFSYRVVVHDGDARDARIADHYNQYINPPQVTILD